MIGYLAVWPVVISTISAFIALAALSVAFAKFRMDLYDRRFSIYTITLELYQVSLGDDGEALDRLSKAFIARVRESQFLFDDKDHIYDRLIEFQTEIFKLKGLKDMSGSKDKSPELIKILYDQSIGAGAHFKLEKILKDLELRLRPYLTYRVFDPFFWRYWYKPTKKKPFPPVKYP